MFRALSLSLFATALGLAALGPAQAATVHLADIVSDPMAVNDFELAPEFRATTWTQQGIRATQMDGTGEADAIWLAAGLGLGARSWYPNGGDDGWTRLTLDSGNNFDAISFFGGSGWLQSPQTMYFELAANGMLVLSGTLAATFAGSWYGFAGGDFDEVRLRASGGDVSSLIDCPVGPPGPNNGCNFAWVDEIRVGAARSVSEPGSVALVLAALFLLSRFARRPGAPSGVRASLCATVATTSSVGPPMRTSPMTGWGSGSPSSPLHGPNPSGRWVTEV